MFFKLDNEGKVEIESDILREIPEFKCIIDRDRGSTGDSTGKKKLQAFKEIKYIYLYCHPDSPIINESTKRRHTKAITMSGLSESWKVDEDIKSAMDWLEEYMALKLPSMKLLVSLERTLVSSTRIVEGLEERLQNEMLSATFTADDPIFITLNQIQNLASTLPGSILKVQDLKKRLESEKANAGVLRATGNRQLGSREQ